MTACFAQMQTQNATIVMILLQPAKASQTRPRAMPYMPIELKIFLETVLLTSPELVSLSLPIPMG